MNSIIVIVGPTGVGKTKLSLSLANIYNGEIINADSMQVYKGLDIGTAKVKKSEMKGIKHHLLDIKEVEDDYSAYDYQNDCRNKITEILNKRKIPIIVGGTGYYIKAALYDYKFSTEDVKDKAYDELNNEAIYNKILEYDSEFIIDRNNRKRLVRALNKLEKETFIYQNDRPLLYPNTIFIGLSGNDKLYDIINDRVDKMLIDLVDEVKKYYLQDIRSKSIMMGIGYKELYDFFDNTTTFRESIDLIKQNSRNYAKRQYTFFNNQMSINWFNVNYDNFDETISDICHFIEGI